MASVDDLRSGRVRTYALAALLAAFAFRCKDILLVLRDQPAGVDFSALWAGGKALRRAGHLYDFAYVTALQGWPMGPAELRPFIYPPSSLLVFAPAAALPYWVAYSLWLVATFALFAWGARRVGAPWWVALFPVVWLVGVCGQITFLIGGLVALALTVGGRPVLAGVLLGAAAALKPQLLVFAPLALVAARQWRSLWAAGAAGLAACGLSLALWGPGVWLEWPSAVARFQREVVSTDPGLLAHQITPFGNLARAGLPGSWAFVLAPLAALMVWRTFRHPHDAADRLIVLFGAAILVSPYVMHYDAALLAPGVAAYLARTRDRLWLFYAGAAVVYTAGLVWGCAPLFAALALPASTWVRALSLETRVRTRAA